MAIGSQNTVGAIYVVRELGIACSTWLDCTTVNWTCNIRELVTVTHVVRKHCVVYIHTDGTDEQNTLILMVDMRAKKCGSNPEFITQCEVH